MKFFLGFKIYDLTEQHGHKVLHIPPYHFHLNPTELVWSQTERYYNSSIGQFGFGMEAVKRCGRNYWNRFVCFSVLTIKERL
jgi:transposase